MKNKYMALWSILLLLHFSCEKIDLQREAKVISKEVSNVAASSALAEAELIDEGEGNISELGFALGQSIDPDVIDRTYQVQGTAAAGIYTLTLDGLQSQTKYYVRPYVIAGGEVFYGNNMEFTTVAAPPSGGEWLYYDDGINYDAIGFTEGGNFDIAINFEAVDLEDYIGYRLVKYSFFPAEAEETSYSVTLWDGNSFVFDEAVTGVTANTWNEHQVQNVYHIQAGLDIIAGIWIQDSPPGSFPAGVDDGPAIKYYGDIFSTDDGENWFSLAEQFPDLNYNWNLRIYLEDQKGKQVMLHSGSKKRKNSMDTRERILEPKHQSGQFLSKSTNR